MSLNWKEINLVLEELDLCGAQIQNAAQSTFDTLGLRVHKKGVTRQLLIALTPGSCRLHETFKPFPKSDKPLRFAQFLNSRIVNGWIEEAEQIGDDRIVTLVIRKGENRFRMYIRLWSNAANCIVTDESGKVLDAMRRLPKKGEISGGRYAVSAQPIATMAQNTQASEGRPIREYTIRTFNDACTAAIADDSISANDSAESFNAKIDAFYAEQGGRLSLEALREQARRNCEGSAARLTAALEHLRAREAEFAEADRLREYGDIIMANIARIEKGAAWLEAENFYATATDGDIAGNTGANKTIRIKLDPHKSPSAQAEIYYEQYAKEKNGLAGIRAEIAAGERELTTVEEKLASLLSVDNPLVLAKLLKTGNTTPDKAASIIAADKKRPGLSFRRGDWLIIVGRDAAENDALLRRHVKGGDLWLHARDFPGAYVFIKQRAGKSFPLDILLDAGNLAIFYSKGRSGGEGDLFYTPVKYLRRAKNGPKGLVIPTQEKNLHVKVDEKRLKELEACRITK